MRLALLLVFLIAQLLCSASDYGSNSRPWHAHVAGDLARVFERVAGRDWSRARRVRPQARGARTSCPPAGEARSSNY